MKIVDPDIRCWLCQAMESQPVVAESEHCALIRHPDSGRLVAMTKGHDVPPSGPVIQEAVDLLVEEKKEGLFSDTDQCVGHWCMTVHPAKAGESHTRAE